MNKNTLGTLTQYSPLDSNNDASYQHDISYLHIRDLNTDDNEQLLTELIGNKKIHPEIDNDSDRKERLRTQATVDIYERLEYISAEDFEGYCIEFPSTT